MSWSKRIRIVFNGKVYNVAPSLKNYFRLVEGIYGTYIYPASVTYGANDHEIYLNFDDFYRVMQPFTLEYLGGTTFGGKDFVMDPFVIAATIYNVNPSDVDEYLAVSDISVSGVITVGFDGKFYNDEYLKVASINVVGTNALLQFYKRYATEYLEVASINVSGQYCDINGVPL